MNTIYTIEEYMAQGFTREEAPIARKCDCLYNKGYENLTEKEREHYHAMANWLGL